MGAHTKALCLTADSSSSNDEDETYKAGFTSDNVIIAATAAALFMFALKGVKKF